MNNQCNKPLKRNRIIIAPNNWRVDRRAKLTVRKRACTPELGLMNIMILPERSEEVTIQQPQPRLEINQINEPTKQRKVTLC